MEPQVPTVATPTCKQALSEESLVSPTPLRTTWTKRRYLGKSSSPISDTDIMDKNLDVNEIFHDNHPWVILFNAFEAEKTVQAEAGKYTQVIL